MAGNVTGQAEFSMFSLSLRDEWDKQNFYSGPPTATEEEPDDHTITKGVSELRTNGNTNGTNGHPPATGLSNGS